MFENIKSRFWAKRCTNTIAKNRLQMVLVQDRSGLSSEEMDFFRRDLLEVISKYFVIESKTLDIDWQRTRNETALVINTPVTGRHKVSRIGRAAAI